MKTYHYALAALPHFKTLYAAHSTEQLKRYSTLIAWFNKSFRASGCHLASSSGRVEIVGNHTDHNGGKVLCAAVSRDILAAFLPRNDGVIVVKSRGFRDIEFNISDTLTPEVSSRGMAKGVVEGFKRRGLNVGGFNACMDSMVNSGAGLSSSAAFELLIGKIISLLYNNDSVAPAELAQIGQFAENVYFNKPSGLLDQSAIALGGIQKIDFSSGLSAEKVDSNIRGYSFVVTNTGTSHSNLTQHYAAIPTEMKAAAAFFGADKLCNVAESDFFGSFSKVVDACGQRAALRAKHFFEENHIIDKAAAALTSGNAEAFLAAVNASGVSSEIQLQNVSYGGGDTLYIDAINNSRSFNPHGANRVHGGGFAGTVLAIVPDEEVKRYVENMSKIYGKDNILPLKVRPVGVVGI